MAHPSQLASSREHVAGRSVQHDPLISLPHSLTARILARPSARTRIVRMTAASLCLQAAGTQ
eukprot:4472357-Prymnesium_polylepis.1